MRIRVLLLAVAFSTAAGSAFAATATGTFNSQITITAECKVQSASAMNFGSHGVLDAAVTSSSTIGVQCTNNQGYSVSLDGGLNGNTTTRKMKNGSEFVNYSLWQDASHTQNWGNTAGTDTLASLTGNGSTQSYTVYGLVPAQATPTANTYTDTVTVTVTYP
jgi:spore coat protein U-like protein